MLGLMLVAAAALVAPTPPAGDDRTAILAAVNHTLDLVGTGTTTELAEALDPTGRMILIDRRDGGETVAIRPMQQFIDNHPKHIEKFAERIGIPILLQRGSLARVWAPYAFWVDGKKSHCGIDDFQLVRRDGKWVVTDLSFTMEPIATCADLGAPEQPR